MVSFRSCTLVGIALTSVVTALNFAVIGDFGMGGYPAGSVRETRSAGALNEVCDKIGCNFTLSVGDNIYTGDVNVGLRDSFEKGFTRDMPFFMSVGNHDNVGPQLQYTQRSKRWYFPQDHFMVELPIDNTGYTVLIFSVNTMDGGLAGGGQYAWIENELKHTKARWKFLFGHFPTMGSGRHRRSGSVGRIHQLMEQYNVQAYFCGHDHILEVSNIGGRVLPISGAMARGGMMLKGIGGAFRRWSDTSPSEYNKYTQDWPMHGFITGDLSPNVMTLSFWDCFGGIMYELTTTWDWIQQAKTIPAEEQNNWPNATFVRQAFRDEMKLPIGPGGGTAFWADGTRHELPRALGANETAAPTTAAPPTTTLPPGVTTTTTNAPAATMLTQSPKNVDTPRPAVTQPEGCGTPPAWFLVRYAIAASASCVDCGDQVPAGIPFTLYLSGLDAGPCLHAFLSMSALGCALANQPGNNFIVAGTSRHAPVLENTLVFTTSIGTPTTQVYVCVSADRGVTFNAIKRADTYSYTFAIREAGFGTPVTMRPPAPTSLTGPTTKAPSASLQQQQQGTAAPSPSSASNGGGLSMTAMVVFGVICGVVGAGLFTFVRTANWRGFNRLVGDPIATVEDNGVQ